MGHGIIRIDGNRLVITDDGFCESILVEFVPVRSSPQVCLVRLWIICAALRQTRQLIARQMRHDRLGDTRRDHIFQREDVSKLFIELTGPGGRAVADIKQLYSNANAIVGASNSAFEYEGDGQFASGYQRIDVVVTQYAARRSDGEALNRAESRDQSVSQASTQII